MGGEMSGVDHNNEARNLTNLSSLITLAQQVAATVSSTSPSYDELIQGLGIAAISVMRLGAEQRAHAKRLERC